MSSPTKFAGASRNPGEPPALAIRAAAEPASVADTGIAVIALEVFDLSNMAAVEDAKARLEMGAQLDVVPSYPPRLWRTCSNSTNLSGFRDAQGVSAMTVARRMGPAGSPVWHSMLDGTEEVLREEGYGALTSRRVAEATGVKQRLIYYYFETMDDLIVETFRRLATRDLERLRESLKANLPLRAIWERCVDNADTRLTAEFVALANRIEALRTEVIAYTEQTRTLIADALRGEGKGTPALPPVAAAFLATSMAIALHREGALGVTMGHAEVLALIDGYLDRS
jgi:AcrR family transcriptional regulator